MPRKLFIPAIGVVAILMLPTQLSGGKPPRPGTADPSLTYLYGGSVEDVWVSNVDGRDATRIYDNRSSHVERPRMAQDRRSVVFVEIPLYSGTQIRRTRYNVNNGVIAVIGTETLLEGTILRDVVLSPDGQRFAVATEYDGIFEFFIADCAPPNAPCTLEATDPRGRLLYAPPSGSGRWIGTLGGYTTSGAALYFVETWEVPPPAAYASELLRLDLFASPPGAEVVLPGFWARFMDLGRQDYGGLDTMILYNQGDKLFVLDTRTGNSTTLAGRHAAGTWSAADDSQIIAITVQRGSNWLFGPLEKLDAATGQTLARVIDWGGYPDWR